MGNEKEGDQRKEKKGSEAETNWRRESGVESDGVEREWRARKVKIREEN